MEPNNTSLLGPMSKREHILGWCYILAQQYAVPFLIALFMAVCGLPRTELILNLIFFTVNFLAVCAIFHRFLKQELTTLCKRPMPALLAVLLGWLLNWGLSILVNLLILSLMPDLVNENQAAITQMASQAYWPMFVCTVVFAPVTEELLYRGVIFGCLRRHGRILAYGLSVLLFSAIHVVGRGYDARELIIATLQYVPGSIALAWTYDRTGTLCAPIFLHCLINAISMLIMR